ncbi:hypothetical protein [Capnocytophaga canis]|uniref:Transglutaminase-like domain-containing protein n=1 Tax=Capnocytophaga canis TaxID=1848903 RepID=A0A0B7IVD8_9FLAO|nr:hypothetical protein [Capnocytophaga canis]CEN53913.1 hypothetical protein CCAND93_630010 [Capnocytophaga canis]
MTRAEINKTLYRPIRAGKQYESVMPFSDCSSTKLGYGDTQFAINNMAKTAKKYKHHTTELSKKFFANQPLQRLCNNIHNFLFWHFQYAIDGDDQLLRSPACSWVSRKQGIDCKSYSIFASTILLNLGVSHYMRRIKQHSNPHGFTHVYVIVPKDQKNHNLSQGYYVIDGTINSSVEPHFLEKDDVFVKADSKDGLGVPAVFVQTAKTTAETTIPQKRKAWETFVQSLETMERMNPENADLKRLKIRVHQLAMQGRTDVRFSMNGFTVILENERFELWKKPVSQLGNAERNQVIDNIINDAYQQSSAYLEQVNASKKAQTVAVVNAVGNASAALVNVIPGIGQIISVALVAVTALVSMAVMFGYDPCSSRFYRTDYINENLEKKFLPQFKATLDRVEAHFKNGTTVLAADDLNKLLQEIDLGVAHFLHEMQVVTDDCNRSVLQGYVNFVKGIQQAVSTTLEGIKANLDPYFNVAVVEKEASVNARSWFFIVPISRNAVRKKFRFLEVESRDKKKGIYPYASEENFDNWLNNNVSEIKFNYGQAAADNYKREMLPFKEKIKKIRENLNIPVVTRVVLEDELRKQQYDIYLKYDKKYMEGLVKKAKDEAVAYALANKSFWEELKKLRQMRFKDEKNRVENIRRIAFGDARRDFKTEKKKQENVLLLGMIGIGTLVLMNEL